MATERLSIEKRVKCVRLYSATKNLSEVQRLLLQEYGPPATKLQTISRINKLFDRTGSVHDAKKPGRERTVRTHQNRLVLEAELARSP